MRRFRADCVKIGDLIEAYAYPYRPTPLNDHQLKAGGFKSFRRT